MDEPDGGNQRAGVDQILQEYDQQRSRFESFCKKVHAYLDERLREKEIPFQTVLYRIKDREKVRSKYDRPSKAGKYNALNDITDIAGLRVITYYEDDVDAVREVIEGAFEIDRENFEDKREPDDPENFSYHALHLVISLKPSTLGDHSFKQLQGMRGEVQITSVLRHAWAEISHKWYDLDERFPRNVKRRFARLSALIDLADEQFVKLRDELEQVNSSIDRSVEGGFVDIPIDAQSLRAFIEQEPLVRQIEQEIAAATSLIVGDSLSESRINIAVGLLKNLGIDSIKDLREDLRKFRVALLEYVTGTPPFWRTANRSVSPNREIGICVIDLAMMILLSNFAEKHKDEVAETFRDNFSKNTESLGVHWLQSADRIKKNALAANAITSKYRA